MTLPSALYRNAEFTYEPATALLRYCAIALLRYCATALLCYCATALLRYCATVLLRYCVTALLRYCATAITNCPHFKIPITTPSGTKLQTYRHHTFLTVLYLTLCHPRNICEGWRVQFITILYLYVLRRFAQYNYTSFSFPVSAH